MGCIMGKEGMGRERRERGARGTAAAGEELDEEPDKELAKGAGLVAAAVPVEPDFFSFFLGKNKARMSKLCPSFLRKGFCFGNFNFFPSKKKTRRSGLILNNRAAWTLS